MNGYLDMTSFVLEVPLNPDRPTNQPLLGVESTITVINQPTMTLLYASQLIFIGHNAEAVTTFYRGVSSVRTGLSCYRLRWFTDLL